MLPKLGKYDDDFIQILPPTKNFAGKVFKGGKIHRKTS